MRPYRRQALLLVLIMGLVALLAQVAGVGTKVGTAPAPTWRSLAVVAGGSVPDVGSTGLERAVVDATEGETVRMRATADLRLARVPRGERVEVVCGIRYGRAGDRSWTLGVPYEATVLDRSSSRARVVVERTFAAPASDRYRMDVACHVLSPVTGASVTATGSMRAALGLPAGAARPVD